MLSYPYKHSDADPGGEEIRRLTSLSGLDLFFGKFECATVYLPGFSFKSRAGRGLKDVLISQNSKEEDLFWRTIQSPPIDLSIINSRRELIIELRKLIKTTEQIHSDIGQRSVLRNNLALLFATPSSEFDTSRSPRNHLEILIDDHGVTAENVDIKLREFSDLPSSSCYQQEGRLEPVDMIKSLLSLEPTRLKIIEAIRKIAEFDNPNLTAISVSLLESAEALGEMAPGRIMRAAPNKSQSAELIQLAEDFNEQLSKFGMLCSFAKLAEKDQYCQCAFDGTKDDLYKKAWNMLRDKDGHNGGFDRDYAPPQVKGDSPSNKRHIVICGSNTAGKTFCGERDLSLRLVAQSFGFAPAKEANIHLADSFIRVDRTSPAETEVVINGTSKKPSDFAREVLVRKNAYSKIGASCRWYSDESWTTTSPNYEFLMNVAEALFLKSKGVRLFTITHNTEALKFWKTQDDVSVHHFQVDESDGEKPKFTRKLVEGIDASRAFEVALALKMDPEFVQYGKEYLEGRYTVVRPAERDIKVAGYAIDVRTELKKEAKSLRSLVPQSDELVVQQDHNGRMSIRWRSDLDEKRSRDGSNTEPLSIGNSKWSDYYRFPYAVISTNHDLFLANVRHFPFAQDTEFNDYGFFICGLIQHGATNDPKELIERTKLFAELAKDGVLEKLGGNLADLRTALMHIQNIGQLKLDDYPQALLDAINLSIERLNCEFFRHDYLGDIKGLKLLRQSLWLIRHSGAISDVANSFDSCLAKLKEIEELEYKRAMLRNVLKTKYDDVDTSAAERLAQEIGEIESYIRKISQANEPLINKYLTNILAEIKPTIEKTLQKKSLLEIDSRILQQFHRATKDLLDLQNSAIWIRSLQTVVSISTYINDDRCPAGDLLDTLRAIDSVHLNQYANYLEPILESFLSREGKGRDIISDFISANIDRFGEVELSEAAVKRAALDPVSQARLMYELRQLEELLCLAKAIRDGARQEIFAPVDFHGGREISIDNGWNIAKVSADQVRYDRIFYNGQQVEFSVGANMSGKSFDMVGLTWSLQFAQATGWAPGSKARLPIFDRIIHIERVPERRDLNLSAFGTEVYYWNSVVSDIKSGGLIYLAADEPFSSTSSYYRDPFNFSIGAWIAKHGAVATIATHCQQPVRHFLAANPGLARATHHKTSVDEVGNIVFQYEKSNGLDDSDALSVAKALGLPQEILDIASRIAVI